MPGKRIDSRAHHGPEEDRARAPSEDRGTRKRKLRFGEKNPSGLTKKDEARANAWRDA